MTTMAVIPEMTAARVTDTQRNSRRSEKPETPPKGLKYYTSLDYPVELVRDDGTYVASHPDLPGCVSMGSTPNEAVENLAEVKTLWLEGQLAGGFAIPEPSEPEQFSGKFVLRIPKLLHRMADYRARQEGVSLNSYVTSVLAGALRYPSRTAKEQRSLTLKTGESFRHQPPKFWCRRDQDWDIGMLGRNRRVHTRDIAPDSMWFVGAVAQQIGNHSKSTIKLSEFKDYHRAEEESHFISK